MPDLKPGAKLVDRFTLLRSIGGSGGSQVWLAHDDELDQQLVVKILRPGAGDDDVALLRRECRHARRLSHPNIVRVFDFHRDGPLVFITMEAVDGTDLGRLRGAALPEVLDVFVSIADALAYAHRMGVVHRDLKRANVLLDAEVGPRIVDFGISDLLGDGTDGLRLRGGGTRPGAAPQQLAGSPASPGDDVFALGVLLLELVSGQTCDPHGVAPLSLLDRPGVPAALRELILRTLAPREQDRPGDMAALRDELARIRAELEEHENDPAETVTLSPPPRAAPIRPAQVAPRSTARPRPRRGRNMLRLAAVCFSILVPAAAAAAIFIFLPRWSEALRAREVSPAETSPATVEPPRPEVEAARAAPQAMDRDARERAAQRLRVDELAERAATLQSELEALAVAEWRGTEFREALDRRERGAAAAAAEDYPAAERSFDDAVAGFEAVLAQSAAAHAAALEAGAAALAAGDAEGAAAAFALAGRIRPGSAGAATGAARAAVLDAVFAELDAARRLEGDGELAEAQLRYARAAELDARNVAAGEGLERVRRLRAAAAFAEAMSDGLAALEDGDYGVAREALGRAAALRPGSPEVGEALAQAQESLKLDAIAANRIRAEGFEREERWREAADRYSAVLDLDASIAFAQEGQRRGLARADLQQRLEYHVAHPERLSGDDVLQEALSLLDEARAIEAPGPSHRDLLERLDDAVGRAATPVQVVLESDDATEIVVYRVGSLGTFTRRTLELRPGRYTVVGSRRGFRDVRHDLVVLPGTSPAPLLVRCEEEI